MDGYIARKTNTTSKLGEKLDSAADLIMVVVLIIVLFPVIDISVGVVYWITGIALIRFASIITVFIKYSSFGMLHSIGNKITGFMLFFFPWIIKSNILVFLLCIVASISATEEFIIHLFSKELDRNRKSISAYNFYREIELERGIIKIGVREKKEHNEIGNREVRTL